MTPCLILNLVFTDTMLTSHLLLLSPDILLNLPLHLTDTFLTPFYV